MTVLRPSPIVVGAVLYFLTVIVAGVLICCDSAPGPEDAGDDNCHSGGY